ncbi:MAG: hypothetical protein K2P81_07315 [Bacteriovoracaceae bacterium]|nr:hypothetical protein [Bacteriovoracaceae bacterium]
MSRSFSSKILLFGEYTVIGGGQALAIPYANFNGHWGKQAPPFDWNPLLRFLSGQPELEIDFKRLESDIKNGGGFSSTIPQGKGLGSSGALVAALLHTYGPEREWTLLEAKDRLSKLEACYHGQSSGVDPLVSWVGEPLLLSGDQDPRIVKLPTKTWQDLNRWYLFDSGVARHSAPLVSVFKKKIEEKEFKKSVSYLETMVGEAIEAYEHLDEAMMGVYMEAISKLQLESFKEMIPASVQEVWIKGLESRDYALKLCGAGGGGYFIAYRLKNIPTHWLKF